MARSNRHTSSEKDIKFTDSEQALAERPPLTENTNAQEISFLKPKKSARKRAASTTAVVGRDGGGVKMTKKKKKKKFMTAVADDAAVKLKTSSRKSGAKQAATSTADVGQVGGGPRKMKKKMKKDLSVVFADYSPSTTFTLIPAAALGDEESTKGWVQLRLWNMQDEIAILKGMYEFRAKTGCDASLNSAAFFDFIKDCFCGQVSKKQLMDKIRKMKNDFLEMSKRGDGLSFSCAHTSDVFELSKKVWDNGEVDEETQALNTGHAKGNLKCETPVIKYQSNPEVVSNWTEEIVEEENEGKVMNCIDVDEFCAQYPYLVAAVETMMSQRMLSVFPKGVLLEKVGGFRGEKVREWDDKWKALCFEEMQLQIKKFKYAAQLSKAAF